MPYDLNEMTRKSLSHTSHYTDGIKVEPTRPYDSSKSGIKLRGVLCPLQCIYGEKYRKTLALRSVRILRPLTMLCFPVNTSVRFRLSFAAIICSSLSRASISSPTCGRSLSTAAMYVSVDTESQSNGSGPAWSLFCDLIRDSAACDARDDVKMYRLNHTPGLIADYRAQYPIRAQRNEVEAREMKEERTKLQKCRSKSVEQPGLPISGTCVFDF